MTFLLIKQCFSIQDRHSFSLKLEDTENWLYEEGEDQQKQVYIDKMAELKVNMDADLLKFETVMPGSDCTIFLTPKFLSWTTNLQTTLPDQLLLAVFNDV